MRDAHNDDEVRRFTRPAPVPVRHGYKEPGRCVPKRLLGGMKGCVKVVLTNGAQGAWESRTVCLGSVRAGESRLARGTDAADAGWSSIALPPK